MWSGLVEFDLFHKLLSYLEHRRTRLALLLRLSRLALGTWITLSQRNITCVWHTLTVLNVSAVGSEVSIYGHTLRVCAFCFGSRVRLHPGLRFLLPSDVLHIRWNRRWENEGRWTAQILIDSCFAFIHTVIFWFQWCLTLPWMTSGRVRCGTSLCGRVCSSVRGFMCVCIVWNGTPRFTARVPG